MARLPAPPVPYPSSSSSSCCAPASLAAPAAASAPIGRRLEPDGHRGRLQGPGPELRRRAGRPARPTASPCQHRGLSPRRPPTMGHPSPRRNLHSSQRHAEDRDRPGDRRHRRRASPRPSSSSRCRRGNRQARASDPSTTTTTPGDALDRRRVGRRVRVTRSSRSRSRPHRAGRARWPSTSKPRTGPRRRGTTPHSHRHGELRRRRDGSKTVSVPIASDSLTSRTKPSRSTATGVCRRAARRRRVWHRDDRDDDQTGPSRAPDRQPQPGLPVRSSSSTGRARPIPRADQLTYRWDLDSDGSFGPTPGRTAAGLRLLHTGAQSAGVRVTDDEGLSDDAHRGPQSSPIPCRPRSARQPRPPASPGAISRSLRRARAAECGATALLGGVHHGRRRPLHRRTSRRRIGLRRQPEPGQGEHARRSRRDRAPGRSSSAAAPGGRSRPSEGSA